MIDLSVNIYMDALTLLTGNKVDITQEVRSAILQTNYYEEQLWSDLWCQYDDFKDIESTEWPPIVNYLTVKEDRTEFDYSESAAMDDIRMLAFSIPCEFDDERFMEDLRKRYQELDLD